MPATSRVLAAATSRPVAALASQALVAGCSLVLQLLVSRSLGAGALGRLSLLLGALIALNALVSGWIGDSLTVLDRHDPAIRAALQVHLVGALAVLVAVGVAVGAAVQGGLRSGVLFPVLVVLWAVEETGRRLLIARRELWSLALNDLLYAGTTSTLLVVLMAAGARLSVELVLLTMSCGAAAAIALALRQLPRVEWVPVRGGRPALRQLTSFALWRGLQVGLRPLALQVVRVGVAVSTSTAALGRLEAARLVMAPVLTVMGGIGVYLLPTYADSVRHGRRPRPPLGAMTAALVALPVVFLVVVLTMRDPVIQLLTDGRYEVSTGALVAWGAYAAAFGAGIPSAHLVTARGRSRLSFGVRSIDNAVGAVLALGCAALGAVAAVPAGLAVGASLGALLLGLAARRSSSSDAPPWQPPLSTRSAPG